MTTETIDHAVTASPIDLDLDTRIGTTGPDAAALLSSADDGCDTVKGGDCCPRRRSSRQAAYRGPTHIREEHRHECRHGSQRAPS